MLKRPPRIQKKVTSQKVVIPPPPPMPSKPGSLDWVSIGIPLLATILSVVLMLSLSGNSSSYWYFLPIMFASYLSAGINWVVQTKKYKKKFQLAKSEYTNQLEKIDAYLSKLAKEEYDCRINNDPAINNCLSMAQNSDPKLGERRPDLQNEDFLSVRFGTKLQKSYIEVISPPRESRQLDLDDEYKFADNLKDKYSEIKDLPFLINFLDTPHLGISGTCEDTSNIARSLIVHLCTHHWPTEVQILAATTLGNEDKWNWIESLPHKIQPEICGKSVLTINSPKDKNIQMLEQEIQTRITMIENQPKNTDQTKLAFTPAYFIILDNIDNYFEYSAFALSLKQKKSINIYVIFLVNKPNEIPSACEAFIEVNNGRAAYRETGSSGRIFENIEIDSTPENLAIEFASHLKKQVWLSAQQVTDPPKKFPLLDLFEENSLEELPILNWWENGSPFGYLRAPIGKISPTNDFILDLDENDYAHGPHGVIGGTTGSGKSELLKTIVLSLALTHHPYDLNFILIDFKGGAAFNDLRDLPHVVGVVTDIETHENYAERVMLALKSEIRTRKEILNRAYDHYGFERLHIDEYRKLMVKQPLPRLIIIFDEFAEFQNRYEKESKNLISIASQGRSLGVHLILCTQKPQSVIEESISSNTRFRMCLKMNSIKDGEALIGAPEAWRLPRGRAFFRVNDLIQFQAAFTGDQYLPNSLINTSDKRNNNIDDVNKKRTGNNETPTEALAIVRTIKKRMGEICLRRPPKVWLDPLERKIFLPGLISKDLQPSWNGKNWTSYNLNPTAVLGLCDDPVNREQPKYLYNPNSGSGSLLVFGGPGSGKTTLLKTLTLSLAYMGTPAEIQFHGIDFTGQANLKSLKKIPHVGTIVTRGQWEIADRLLNLLKQTISERGSLFRKPNIDVYDIDEFNSKVGSADRLPIIFLLIDSFGELKRAYQEQNKNDIKNKIIELAQGGRSAGVHLIVTSNLTDDLPEELFNVIEERITFRQAQRTQLNSILGQISDQALQMSSGTIPPAGRGLVKVPMVLDFQSALPGMDNSETDGSSFIDNVTSKMEKWDGKRPPMIEELPSNIYWKDLEKYPADKIKGDTEESLAIPLGVRYDNLFRIGLDIAKDSVCFFVTSTIPERGKTSLLQTWIYFLADKYSPTNVKFSFIDFHTHSFSEIRKIPHKLHYVNFEDQLDSAIQDLEKEFCERQKLVHEGYKKDPDGFEVSKFLIMKKKPIIIIIIDDYDSFRNRVDVSSNYINRINKIMFDGEKTGFRLIIANSFSPLSTSDVITQRTFMQACGIHLGGVDGIDYPLNMKVAIPFSMNQLREGRGYLIHKGNAHLFQSASFWEELNIDPDNEEIEKLNTQLNISDTIINKWTSKK